MLNWVQEAVSCYLNGVSDCGDFNFDEAIKETLLTDDLDAMEFLLGFESFRDADFSELRAKYIKLTQKFIDFTEYNDWEEITICKTDMLLDPVIWVGKQTKTEREL